MSKFVKNCWYMVAWADELDAGPLSRRILDVPTVLFRTESGKLAAVVDRCPHRFAPLSKGKVSGEAIQCGYHGLGFNAQGECVISPFGLSVPPGAQVASFPVVEKQLGVWLWPGDASLADPAQIPDFSYHVDPHYRNVKGHSHIKSNFELVTDNLMDLTHTRYLHPAFGGDDWVPEVEFSNQGETVNAHYHLPDYPCTIFGDAFFVEPANGRRIWEKDIMRWDAPATMYLSIDLGFVGESARRAHQPSSHILCPETETTTHYFWASGAEFDAPTTNEEHYEVLRHAFDVEDATMLEAVQANMDGGNFWDMRPAILAYDSAGIRARRIMLSKLRAENPPPVKKTARRKADEPVGAK